MYKVAILDFDGTIADTLNSIIKLYNEVAPKYNLETIKNSEKEKLRNYSAIELLKMYRVSPWKLLVLVKEIRSKLKNNIQDIPIVEGIKKVFQDLEERGIKVGIVTSNSVENVQLFLKKWDITNTNFIYSENNLFGKGKVLNHLIQKRKLNREEVVYIGDEARDVEAARKAGIAIIAVTWGFNSEKRLRQSKPDYLISKPKELLEKLDILE